MKEFSIENESGLTHKFLGSHEERHVREELDAILNDKVLLEKKLGEAVWTGSHAILDDLTKLVLLRIEGKYGGIEKYPRELVKKIITDNKNEKIKIKKTDDKFIVTITGAKTIVSEDDLEILKKCGRYPKG